MLFVRGHIPWSKGKKFSDEYRKKLSLARIGKVPVNKILNDVECHYCKKIFHKKPSHTFDKNFCNRNCFNNWRREYDFVSKERLRELAKKRDRGLTSGREKIKQGYAYRNWRRSVFMRDNFTCRECGISGVYIHAHHIKPFHLYIESRFDLDNGITLCKDCHKKTDSYGKIRS